MMDALDQSEVEEPKQRITASQWSIIALALAFAVGAMLYRILMHRQLGHSAAMFLGIPTVLAVMIALTPKTKTVTGGILKGITLALLVIAPLVGEGYVCILFAAPLFYVVGIVVGSIVDFAVRRRRESRTTTISCVALILLPMCLEGTTPRLTWPREQSVAATRIVAASPEEVELTLAQSPRVDTRLPPFLSIGFPRPLEAHGDGLLPGATRTIHFSGAEGDPPGDLVLRVTERRPGYVRFETVSDGSKLTQWIRWQSSEIEWKPVDPAHTAVTWRIHFQRQLDPAWYFIPWERAALREAAGFLIAANAIPAKTTLTPAEPHDQE
jgi:hypothetical protein